MLFLNFSKILDLLWAITCVNTKSLGGKLSKKFVRDYFENKLIKHVVAFLCWDITGRKMFLRDRSLITQFLIFKRSGVFINKGGGSDLFLLFVFKEKIQKIMRF